MKKTIFSLLLAFSLPVDAVICKSVDAKGNVSYANIPEDECQNKVKLPPVSHYQPRALPQSESPVSDTPEVEKYTAMKISQPANDGTVRNNEGQVLVVVDLQPGLQKGDKLKLLVDGIAVKPMFDGLTVTLEGVLRGTHSLSAKIVDAAGKVKRSAKPVSFTLRKASLLDPLRRKAAGKN